jgi:hypothetical protein
MAAREDHRELIVGELSGERAAPRRSSLFLQAGQGLADRIFFLTPCRGAPQRVERPILGHLGQPRARVSGRPGVGPHPEGLYEGLLDRVLDQVDLLEAEDPRQGRDHLSRSPPEQMIDRRLGFP